MNNQTAAPPFHWYPTSAEQTDTAHDPEARVVRGREDPDCPLCQAGRCWQHVTQQQGRTIVWHGTVEA